jgi:hypothetical protein
LNKGGNNLRRYLGDADIIRVKFGEKKIEITQSWDRELSEVVAARYNGLMLIPNRESAHEIEVGDTAFIFKPRPNSRSIANYHEKFQGVKIIAVNILPINITPTEVIIEDETEKEVEIFENVFVPKDLLKVPYKKGIAQILIREPNEDHDNYLVLIKMEDEDIREVFQVFFERKGYRIKLLDQEKSNNGNLNNLLLEITMNGDMEMEEVKKLVVAPFRAYFKFPEPED